MTIKRIFDGSAPLPDPTPDPTPVPASTSQPCSRCQGTGTYRWATGSGPCFRCGGTGKVEVVARAKSRVFAPGAPMPAPLIVHAAEVLVQCTDAVLIAEIERRGFTVLNTKEVPRGQA